MNAGFIVLVLAVGGIGLLLLAAWHGRSVFDVSRVAACAREEMFARELAEAATVKSMNYWDKCAYLKKHLPDEYKVFTGIEKQMFDRHRVAELSRFRWIRRDLPPNFSDSDQLLVDKDGLVVARVCGRMSTGTWTFAAPFYGGCDFLSTYEYATFEAAQRQMENWVAKAKYSAPENHIAVLEKDPDWLTDEQRAAMARIREALSENGGSQ